MAKKKTKPWDEIFSRIQAIYFPQCRYSPPITSEQLDAVEKELDFQFPLSYREFAMRFGLDGELMCSLPHVLPLTRPKDAKATDWDRSLIDATNFYRTFDWTENRMATPKSFFQRAVIFAMDGGYDTFLFDPLEVTEPDNRECRIYDIPRHGEPTAIAWTFGDWVEWIDQHYRFEDEEEEEEPEEPPRFPAILKPASVVNPIPYWPALLRHKKEPGQRTVKSWLKWNDGAVRKIAQSIHEQKQKDAFPILADALEEAGCTNKDVIYSCREGDPDVDGEWVLRILLD